MTLAVAGLVPEIFAALPDVPFLCDFPRAVAITPQAALYRDHALPQGSP